MLILDQLREADRRLRLVALGVSAGMLILLAGLWHVQIVSGKKYSTNLKDQAFRNVLIAAPRGKILDRNGALLAENQPLFVVNLYLEDLRGQFVFEYTNRVRPDWIAANPGKKVSSVKGALSRQARYNVVSNIVWQVSSAVLPSPLILNETAFAKHYNESLALPMPILTGLSQDQVALFMERASGIPGVELEALPIRLYPEGQLAVHLLGYVRREVMHADDDDDISFIDKTPVLVGKAGIEATFDEELRGRPGLRSILVNNLGYRQKEEVWSSPIPGQNVQLTLDVEIQKAAEAALRMSGPETRAAAVVLDVRTGDVLASASAPSFDPNAFLTRVSPEEFAKMNDPLLRPLLNRAIYGAYPPGSTFKMIDGLAIMESGMFDPRATVYNPGYYKLGRRAINDTAPPGAYDFRESIKHSCNCYFIEYGLRMGPQRLIEMGNRFMLGERTRLVPRGYEVPGYFPETGQRYKKDGTLWMDGDTANLSIGQGEITVTPMQMAVVTAAIANGGKVFQPRLLKSIGAGLVDMAGRVMPPAEIINDIGVNPRHLAILREAMWACVNDGGGGKEAKVEGANVCGKTGTAQAMVNGKRDYVVWFCSFFPYEAPRYALSVMMESGGSGGKDCAPKAREIIKAIVKAEQRQQLGRPVAAVSQ